MLAIIAASSPTFVPGIAPRTAIRAHVVMSDKFDTSGNWENAAKEMDLATYREVEECIVHSENAAEPSPFEEFTNGVTSFFAKFNPAKVEIDVEECVIDAENADELASCFA